MVKIRGVARVHQEDAENTSGRFDVGTDASKGTAEMKKNTLGPVSMIFSKRRKFLKDCRRARSKK
jgi:hypothetical protein